MSEERGQDEMFSSKGERSSFDQVRGTRELSGPGFTEKAGAGLLRQHNTDPKPGSKDGFLTGRMQFSHLWCSIEVLERREFKRVPNQIRIGPFPVPNLESATTTIWYG